MLVGIHHSLKLKLIMSRILSSPSLRDIVAKIADKHWVNMQYILFFCINKYIDIKTNKEFYHNGDCFCHEESCLFCSKYSEATGHKNLSEDLRPYLRGLPVKEMQDVQIHMEKPGLVCFACVWLKTIYHAQAEVVSMAGHLFQDGFEQENFESSSYNFEVQKRHSFMFGGRNTADINGACLCEETPLTVCERNNWFKDKENHLRMSELVELYPSDRE